MITMTACKVKKNETKRKVLSQKHIRSYRLVNVWKLQLMTKAQCNVTHSIKQEEKFQSVNQIMPFLDIKRNTTIQKCRLEVDLIDYNLSVNVTDYKIS